MKYLLCIMLIIPVCAIAVTTNYKCSYTSYSDQEGNHKVKEIFEINFIVDRATGKSYMLGNTGSSEVKALESKDRIAFIEVTVSGNIMTTAIDSKHNSVHSRNTIMFGELSPSQYYGECVVK